MNQIIQTHTQGPQLKSHMRLSVLGLFLALIGQLLVVGCGGSDDDGDDVTPGPVGNTNVAPLIISASPSQSTATVGDSVQLSVTATDADNDPLTYKWTESSGNIIVTNATSTTATADFTGVAADTYTFVIEVDDGVNSPVGDTFTVTVVPGTPGNRPPVITGTTGGGNYSVEPGGGTVSVSLSVDAYDPDNDALTYLWTGTTGDESVTFEGGNNLDEVSASLSEGSYSFTVTVTEVGAEGLAAEETFNVNVTVDGGPIADVYPVTADKVHVPVDDVVTVTFNGFDVTNENLFFFLNANENDDITVVPTAMPNVFNVTCHAVKTTQGGRYFLNWEVVEGTTPLAESSPTIFSGPEAAVQIVAFAKPTPPAVWFTSHFSHTMIPQGEEITLAADALLPEGETVSKIIFSMKPNDFTRSEWLGEDDTAPYTLDVTVHTSDYFMYEVKVVGSNGSEKDEWIHFNYR